MKRIFFIILVLILLITTGCNTELDSKYSEILADYENAAIEFQHLDITFNRYIEKTNDIAINPENLISTNIIKMNKNNEPISIDLKNIDEDQLKELKENSSNINKTSYEVSYKISKPYYFNDKNSAYVFAIRQNIDTFLGKRYTFKKVENNWKIANIDEKSSKTKSEKDAVINTDIDFHRYKDKEINYDKSFSDIIN
ncbi:hypothetical protein GOQ27_00605 [Clostridium sp. D2Q-11]|uniref:Lipoprotein n=1 Tax=Anaeromonas frigoriresistens TaxID=2683708 RepID=A0A942UPK3_9FIRM|nr:hypothetical protein [Anaeromonas frigoriresistens]MBS4536939.1 hypothetical protein [Anaeromonas frigoriresistens]